MFAFLSLVFIVFLRQSSFEREWNNRIRHHIRALDLCWTLQCVCRVSQGLRISCVFPRIFEESLVFVPVFPRALYQLCFSVSLMIRVEYLDVCAVFFWW